MKRFLNNMYLTFQTVNNLSTFILDYLGILRGNVLYKVKGNKYEFIARAGTSDKSEIVAVLSGFEYNLSYLPKIKNPIIFDVGSYIGDSAVYMSDFYNHKCRIYSFEADADNYRYAKMNLLLNNLTTTKLFHVALGSKKGNGYIDKKNKPFDGYRVVQKKQQGEEGFKVSTLPILAREFGLKTIDILKMDIEGGEYEIFNHPASYSFIKSRVKFVLLEYHYDFGTKPVTRLLEKLEKDFTTLYHRENLIYVKNKNLS